MATNDDTRKSFQICPICGERSRKAGCIICLSCRTKWNRALERSAQALVDGDFESVTKVPDIFQHVLDKSEHVLNAQRNRLEEAEAQKLAEEARIRESVMSMISERLLKGDTNPGPEVVSRAVSMQAQKVQRTDERYQIAHRRAFGIGKGLENLLALIEEVKEKREKLLSDQKEASVA